MMTQNTAEQIRLYILMRNDMESLNPGKAVAQGAHAANQCMGEIEDGSDDIHEEWLDVWSNETDKHFGTTIVLAGTIEEIEKAVEIAQEYDLASGLVFDPTYPLRDGQVTHHIPITTCGYVFGPEKSCKAATAAMSLMP